LSRLSECDGIAIYLYFADHGPPHMWALARVSAVEYLGARLLGVTLSDGLLRELDFVDALP
jgi:hypothetical protein